MCGLSTDCSPISKLRLCSFAAGVALPEMSLSAAVGDLRLPKCSSLRSRTSSSTFLLCCYVLRGYSCSTSLSTQYCWWSNFMSPLEKATPCWSRGSSNLRYRFLLLTEWKVLMSLTLLNFLCISSILFPFSSSGASILRTGFPKVKHFSTWSMMFFSRFLV